MDTILHLVTTASEALQAPGTSAKQRREAESVLQQLRNHEDPASIFRYIFDNTNNNLVLFNAATIFKDLIARGHQRLIAPELAEQVRVYLLQFLIAHPQVTRAVREQMLVAVAVLLKRSWLISATDAASSLRSYTTELFKGDIEKRCLALSMLAAILVEFSWNSNATSTGMSIESHLAAKQSFESLYLKDAFHTATCVFRDILSEVVAAGLSDGSKAIFEASLSLCDQLFSWQFSGHKSGSAVRAAQQDVLSNYFRAGGDWHSILTSEVAGLFFQCYPVLRNSSDISHTVRQCLLQIVSAKDVHKGKDSEHAFTLSILNGFVSVVLDYSIFEGNLQGPELLGWAAILDRIVNALGFGRLVNICGAGPVERFLEAAQRLSIYCLQFMAAGNDDDGGSDGEGCASDAVNTMFDAWVGIAPYDCGNHVTAKQSIESILVSYIECRLTKASRDAMDDEEVVEEVEDDAEQYDHQLCSFAFLARYYVERSAPLVSELLCAKLDAFSQSFNGAPEFEHIAIMSEELHWLLLISGFYLTDSDVGERNIIPEQIMRASATVPEGNESSDPFVQMPVRILRCANEVKAATDANRIGRVSSAVVADLMWWLNRWLRAYLMINERKYSDVISMTLIDAFGDGSDGATAAVELIFSTACTVLLYWQGDKHIVANSIAVLDSLSERKVLQNALMKTDTLWRFAEGFRDSSSQVGRLPAELQTFVAKVLCRMCAVAAPDDRLKLFQHLIEPTHSTFMSIIQRPDFNDQLGQVPEVRESISRTIHILCGLARAITDATSTMFFGYFKDMLQPLVDLIIVYKNVPEIYCLIMSLFVDLLKYSAHHIPESEHGFLFAATTSANTRFIENMRKLQSGCDRSRESELNDQTLLLVQLLNAASRVPHYSDSGNPEQNSAAALVFLTLEQLIPLMSQDVLAVPEFSLQYFTLITWTCQEYAEELLASPNLAVMILGTVNHALGMLGDNVSKMTLQSVSYVASAYSSRQQIQSNDAIAGLLHEIHNKIFDMALTEPMSIGLEANACEALFALMCCNQGQFQQKLDALLARQSDRAVAQRIVDAFQNLFGQSGIEFIPDRHNKRAFTVGLRKIIETVKGSILVR